MTSARAWFQFIGNDDSAERRIRSRLADAGLILCPLEELAGHGIACFSEVDDKLLQWLNEIRLRSEGQTMALAVSPSVLNVSNTWNLLHAGAADTLAWDDCGPVADQILARLDRWHTIDELAIDASSRGRLVGESPVWRTLIRKIVEAAHFTTAPVLLIGDSGTGKELMANLIHLASSPDEHGAPRDLVTVDCSTIVPELSGSEFFGHERGAFTGAVSHREGAFALAAGGTLFLDEVGELPLALQAQLLRVVQEKKYKRVGSNVWQTTDFRLVCATNLNLAELVERGRFRLDLYHRISGWVFQMPPLASRSNDILPLANHFLTSTFSRETRLEFDSSVREYLIHRSYPGNVRELRQLVQRIAHRHVGPGPITAGDIPEEDRPASSEANRRWPDKLLEKTIACAITLGMGLKEISQATTETAIRIAVQSENGSLQRAARRLGVTDRALQMRRASEKDRQLVSGAAAAPTRDRGTRSP